MAEFENDDSPTIVKARVVGHSQGGELALPEDMTCEQCDDRLVMLADIDILFLNGQPISAKTVFRCKKCGVDFDHFNEDIPPDLFDRLREDEGQFCH